VSNSWSKQALQSKPEITNSNGRALFGPSVLNLALLQRFDGYSLQVTDPTSHFVQTCGARVGFELGPGPVGTRLPDQFNDARTDGSEHFPVELVDPEALPKNISWFPFLRGTDFHSFMSVQLIPILPSPDGCKPVADPQLLQECTRLNTMAQSALLQELAPMYFAGMQRATIDSEDGWSPEGRIYNVAYETKSDPSRYMVVTIERFPKGQTAREQPNDITRGIPDYDPNSVTEDEVIPGQKVKRITSTRSPRAFWVSQNLVIMITFVRPSPFERMLIGQWLVHHPSDALQTTSESHEHAGSATVRFAIINCCLEVTFCPCAEVVELADTPSKSLNYVFSVTSAE
jgi:hypothetical protein